MVTDEREQRLRITVDKYTRCCLTAIALLLTLVVLGLWTDAPSMVRPAAAGSPGISTAGATLDGETRAPNLLPDRGADRLAMLSELKSINGKLDEISRALVSGKVKVVVVQAEDKSEGSGDAVLPPKTK